MSLVPVSNRCCIVYTSEEEFVKAIEDVVLSIEYQSVFNYASLYELSFNTHVQYNMHCFCL